MSGRTSAAKPTKAATGLPGRPMKGVAFNIPIATGPQGLIANFQNDSAPCCSSKRQTDVILLAHRDAARGEDEIMRLCGARERRGDRIAIVGQDTEITDFQTLPLQHREKHETVRVVDARLAGRRARREDFIAGRKHGGFQSGTHREFG